MNATKKQTAANNDLLKNTKRVFNHLIFKHAAKVCNVEGDLAARVYLQQFVRGDLDAFFTRFGKVL